MNLLSAQLTSVKAYLEALTVKASNEASAAKSAKAELDKIQLELVELKYVTH